MAPLVEAEQLHCWRVVPQTTKPKTQLRQRNRRRRPWLSAPPGPPPSPVPNPYGQTFSSRLSSSARRPVFVGDFAVRGFQLLRRRISVVVLLSVEDGSINQEAVADNNASLSLEQRSSSSRQHC
ncbi:uncharacterized protein DS421_7g222490 [Arachis hypogaea]|nr:uncharacterized protein DS421_7g222490 [Arachis hypogaea]